MRVPSKAPLRALSQLLDWWFSPLLYGSRLDSYKHKSCPQTQTAKPLDFGDLGRCPQCHVGITSDGTDGIETSTGMPTRQVENGFSGVVLDRLKIYQFYHAIKKNLRFYLTNVFYLVSRGRLKLNILYCWSVCPAFS